MDEGGCCTCLALRKIAQASKKLEKSNMEEITMKRMPNSHSYQNTRLVVVYLIFLKSVFKIFSRQGFRYSIKIAAKYRAAYLKKFYIHSDWFVWRLWSTVIAMHCSPL